MDKLLLLFGLMRKAGRVEIGDESATDALRRGDAVAVCCAADASENTMKHFQRAAEGEGIPFVHLHFDKKELGGVFGRETVAVAALTDIGFGARLFEICAEDDPQWKSTAEKYRRKADDLVAEQKRRRKEEKEARMGKRPKPAVPAKPVSPAPKAVEEPKPVKSAESMPESRKFADTPRKNDSFRHDFHGNVSKPAFGSHSEGYHAKSEGYRGKSEGYRGKNDASHGDFRRDSHSNGYHRDFNRNDDRRFDHVSEENPTGKTYGKVYGKAPKSTHVSIGDRRREDAQRQQERYGASENGSRFEKKSFSPRPDGGKPFNKKPFGEKSFDKKPYGEKSFDKKPYGEKSFDKKPFGEKSFGKKPFDKKPYGEKSEYPRKRSTAPYTNSRNGSAYNQGKASRSAQHYADSSVKNRNGGKA